MSLRQQAKRKKFIGFFPIILIFSAAWLLGSGPSRSETRKLNCLIITIDTLRADRLSCYGSLTVKTPTIDGLARQGVVFSRAFAHTVMTLPSHANIFLGSLPAYHGVHDNANFVVPSEVPILSEIFKKHNYATGAFIGAYPLDRRFGLNRGFDVYDDNYGIQDFSRSDFVERKAGEVVQKAIEWLSSVNRSWFLWVHCFDPHAPYSPPAPFSSEYIDNPYDGEVAYVDQVLGDLFTFLKSNDSFGNTLIILTSDHGESLGEHGEMTHGYFAYNPTLLVPLIIVSPGIKAGSVVSSVVSHIDIFPTVCDLLGFEKPKHLKGRSLVPALRGRKIANEKVLFESMYPYYSRGWAPLEGYIDFPEKFIESPIPELYHLQADPGENNNLAPEKDLVLMRAKLKELKEDFAQGIGDVVAQDKVPARDTIKKLRTLGYISSGESSLKKEFGPDDDVKSFMPFENRALEAIEKFSSGGLAKEAIEILESNIRTKKNHDISYTYLARIYFDQGKSAEAIAVLRTGLENLPSNYTIFLAYVSGLLKLAQYEEIISLSSTARMYPQSGYDPEIWNSIGVAYASLGRYDEAMNFYQKAIVIDADFPAALTNLGVAYLMKARTAGDGILVSKAIESFKLAITKDSTYAAGYNGLGAAYKTIGDLENAIACWLEAIKIDPELDFALYNLGYAYLEKGEKSLALKYLLEYKERAYHKLPADEKIALDELILRAKKRA